LTKKQKSTAKVEKSKPDCNNQRLERKEELSLASEHGIHAVSTPEVHFENSTTGWAFLPPGRRTPAFLGFSG
jgi:hypothetical protein